MNFEQIILYYFSGTGNARNAAHWFMQVAEEKQLKTRLINIDRFDQIEIPDTGKKTLIGFCSPTHGFNFPPIMLKFILKFPRLKNADVFIMNTRGGLKLSKLFLPGVSGIAQLLPALILLLKSYKIVGMQPLDLPSNWIFLHPGLKAKVVDSITQRIKKITKKFATNLLEGKRKYKALLSLPIDLAMIPIAFGYYFIGRFYLAKSLVASSNCNSCMKCINECPVEAIKLKKQLFWSYKCESCMRCLNNCPKQAIQVAHSFSIGLLLINFLILMPAIMFLFNDLGFDKSGNPLWLMIILRISKWIVFISFVFLSYRMLNYLMRFKWINKMVEFTSFSKYKFWRRYKAPHY
ncbi:MAG: hypothetical protein CVU00_06210 [Bacteroidetes bacterium HGW-Bacteroidetes-17]|jgi:ferredoxin|nr:MAG: hypothetical protein CVU00_06210 [Bacteroidetes bacterium HGW-Bacteroidetes-17]